MFKRICLTCGADRQELESMLRELDVINNIGGLQEQYESENRGMARIIIDNCQDCKKVFEEANTYLALN